jgi:hypothetical protein
LPVGSIGLIRSISVTRAQPNIVAPASEPGPYAAPSRCGKKARITTAAGYGSRLETGTTALTSDARIRLAMKMLRDARVILR